MPSVSKSQQALMGMAYAVKTGDKQLSDMPTGVQDKIKEIIDSMTEEQIKDFASTPTENLPEEITENLDHKNIRMMYDELIDLEGWIFQNVKPYPFSMDDIMEKYEIEGLGPVKTDWIIEMIRDGELKESQLKKDLEKLRKIKDKEGKSIITDLKNLGKKILGMSESLFEDGYGILNPTLPIGIKEKDYSQEQRDEMANSGEAMPDGSFPIKDKSDIENAVKLAHLAKDEKAAKEHIRKRAKALGAENTLPDSWVKENRQGTSRNKLRTMSQKINEETDFFSTFGIGDSVMFCGDRYGTVASVRFTKAKVFYTILDDYSGELYKDVDSIEVGGYSTNEDMSKAIGYDISQDQVEQAAIDSGLDISEFDPEELQIGVAIELEHGSRDPETNVTNDDMASTLKIAVAHLKENPKYYLELLASGIDEDAAPAGTPASGTPSYATLGSVNGVGGWMPGIQAGKRKLTDKEKEFLKKNDKMSGQESEDK